MGEVQKGRQRQNQGKAAGVAGGKEAGKGRGGKGRQAEPKP